MNEHSVCSAHSHSKFNLNKNRHNDIALEKRAFVKSTTQRRSRIIKIIYIVNRHTTHPNSVKEQVQSNCSGTRYYHVAIITSTHTHTYAQRTVTIIISVGRKMMTHQLNEQKN